MKMARALKTGMKLGHHRLTTTHRILEYSSLKEIIQETTIDISLFPTSD
jgi:hypothetical protein